MAFLVADWALAYFTNNKGIMVAERFHPERTAGLHDRPTRERNTAAGENAVYFTSRATGLQFLTERIAALFPNANRASGDRSR